SSIIISLDDFLSKKFKLCFTAITLIFLILLSSRMALFSFLLIQLVLILKSGINRKTIYLIFIGIILIPVILVISPYLTEKILNQHGIIDRLYLFEASFSIIKANPIFGSSLGDFYSNMRSVLELNDLFMKNVDPHNFFLYLIGSTGLIGLILFIIMIFNFKNNVRYYIFIGYFLISCLTETFLNRQMGGLLVALFVGIIINKYL